MERTPIPHANSTFYVCDSSVSRYPVGSKLVFPNNICTFQKEIGYVLAQENDIFVYPNDPNCTSTTGGFKITDTCSPNLIRFLPRRLLSLSTSRDAYQNNQSVVIPIAVVIAIVVILLLIAKYLFRSSDAAESSSPTASQPLLTSDGQTHYQQSVRVINPSTAPAAALQPIAMHEVPPASPNFVPADASPTEAAPAFPYARSDRLVPIATSDDQLTKGLSAVPTPDGSTGTDVAPSAGAPIPAEAPPASQASAQGGNPPAPGGNGRRGRRGGR